MSAKSLLAPRDAAVPTPPAGDLASADPAVMIVDEALALFAGRTLIARDEVMNRLLDLRNALAAATALRDLDAREAVRR